MSEKIPEIKRVTKKLFIKDILSSTYIKRTGWEPSAIITNYGEVTRVYIMGVVVYSNDDNILIDDGTGNIQVRFFENKFTSSLGDLVLVIGKPREWENSKYIVPEIIKKIDRKWFDVHKLELNIQKKEKISLPVEVEEEIELGPYQKILNVIAALDKGDGVDVNEIIVKLKIDNCEQFINSLIEEGEIFEISPGKVKLLN